MIVVHFIAYRRLRIWRSCCFRVFLQLFLTDCWFLSWFPDQKFASTLVWFVAISWPVLQTGIFFAFCSGCLAFSTQMLVSNVISDNLRTFLQLYYDQFLLREPMEDFEVFFLGWKRGSVRFQKGEGGRGGYRPRQRWISDLISCILVIFFCLCM